MPGNHIDTGNWYLLKKKEKKKLIEKWALNKCNLLALLLKELNSSLLRHHVLVRRLLAVAANTLSLKYNDPVGEGKKGKSF